MKKLFSIIATLALVAGIVIPSTPANASFSNELTGAYEYAYGIGITTMSSIENANMYGSLIRGHMAKMMAEYTKNVLGKTPDTTKACEFTDIAGQNAELRGFIVEACQLGLMGVDITAFRPNDTVTRAEFGTVLSRALWGNTYNGSIPYYADHLNALKDAGVMTMISNPNMLEVRGYVMLMMQRADEDGAATPAICQTPENVLACALGLDSCPAECLPSDDEDEVVILPGFATVSRVGSVNDQYVPKNAVNKKIGTIKLTAGQNDTTVTSVVVKHSGLGEINNDMKVKLLHNGVNVSTERSISTSTKTATVRFSPNLVLKAGSSMDFDVVVSLSGAQNNRHEFAVSDVVVVNGTSTGYPISLASLNTTSYEVKGLT